MERRQLRRLAQALIATFLLMLGTVQAGCRPKNRDLAPDAKMQLGLLKRPAECKKRATVGKKLNVHYSARYFRSCEEFDSSRERGTPFEFTLGKGEVVRGWDRGLMGACEGEIRKLILPSDWAYGDAGVADGSEIKGGITLIYEIEILSVSK